MKKYVFWVLSFCWAVLIWKLTTTPDFSITSDTLLSFLISNGSHFIFFGIEAILLYLSLSSIYFSTILTSLYGIAIELAQRGIPGRTGDPVDWLLDTLGAIIFVYTLKKYSKSI